jgi:dTDP-4-amino-4,6-dideoxygalactose transaminase
MDKKSRLFLSPPHVEGNELKYVQEAFASNYIAPLGAMTEAFEKALSDYTKIPHCLVVNSGTAAIHLALRHFGVGFGDLVLSSSLTFIGSVSFAHHLGAELSFIDSDPQTWNMDSSLLEQALIHCKREGRMPKAVITTDLYGQCSPYDEIIELCKPYGVKVIVDAAESLGATYKGAHAGSKGDASIVSFNGNKIITTSSGGMLASHDAELIEHARKLSTQAREPFSYYEHEEIGYNYRMSNILAAIGLGQLETLSAKLKRRCAINALYQSLLKDEVAISFMPKASFGEPNYWLTVILLDPSKTSLTSDQLRISLEKENIESRPLWKPMHLQPVFKHCRMYGGAVCEHLFQRGLCLPSGSGLANDDVDRVCGVIRRAMK